MKIDYCPNPSKYFEFLTKKTEHIHALVQSSLVMFETCHAFEVIGMENFIPVYKIVGEKKQGEKIQLIISAYKVTSKKVRLKMQVYKPCFSNPGKMKFLYEMIEFKELDILYHISAIK